MEKIIKTKIGNLKNKKENLKTKNENTKVGKKISESAAETVKTKFKKNNEKSVGTKRTNLNSEAKKSEKQNTKQNKINNFTKLKKGKSIKSKIENSENLKTEKVDLKINIINKIKTDQKQKNKTEEKQKDEKKISTKQNAENQISAERITEKEIKTKYIAYANEQDIYLFHQGTNYNSYQFLGCHLTAVDGVSGAFFRVWAPNAVKIAVLGDFNAWDNRKHPMNRISKNGIWEIFIPNAKQWDKYKYEITDKHNYARLKADPYAFFNETNGRTASIVYDISGYEWKDSYYLKKRKEKNVYSSPMNIYEVSASSFKRQPDGDYLTYRMIADELIPYVTEMGYTHIELLPLTEYPFDGSWGYQVTGYFSVTSRFGTPKDFMYFIDRCHTAGIGVIMDWVPAHFAIDEHALIEFDGTRLYENQGADRLEHKTWGTRIFDFGRNEVQCFLISSAMLFLKHYHLDGIRVDAVASMLYLDYDKKDGEWTKNEFGDNKNIEAIAFLRKLNTVLFSEMHDILMIAEESTAWPLVSKPVHAGGLGFNFKWDLGWMNDSLEYISTDPFFRKHKHDKLTFSFFYAFSENFILPISHDEVVHGKKSLLNKMAGEYNDRFKTMRAYLAYMFAHPGKKLIFMGTEFAQYIEWDYKKGIDFCLLEYDSHRLMREFVKQLNFFYLSHSQLFEIDDDWKGFQWIVADDKQQNVLVFLRRDKSDKELIFAVNFSNVLRENYTIGVERDGKYAEIFNTDSPAFGGSGIKNEILYAQKMPMHGKPFSINLKLAPLSAVFIERQTSEIWI